MGSARQKCFWGETLGLVEMLCLKQLDRYAQGFKLQFHGDKCGRCSFHGHAKNLDDVAESMVIDYFLKPWAYKSHHAFKNCLQLIFRHQC